MSVYFCKENSSTVVCKCVVSLTYGTVARMVIFKMPLSFPRADLYFGCLKSSADNATGKRLKLFPSGVKNQFPRLDSLLWSLVLLFCSH